ncbi:MAG: PAS domain-containing protein, partial [Lachnospiraceae bacterium]|nr:PAS domain-containing protein [Lachnospiraceae bacterium]
MILENKYLRKAILKAGYVVIVKSCHVKERKSKLEYISPNASMLGMNVELLNKGMKLTEDYIYPEDRQKVIQTVLAANENEVRDYVHEYRMVGDDGKLYYVSNEISVSEVKDDYFTIEFYIKDIGDKKKYSDTPANISTLEEKSQEKQEDLGDILDDMSLKDKIETIMKVFSGLSDLYSVYVDLDCKIKFPPVGPSTNMGDFYDLFEKPSYKEYFKYIKQVVINNDAPTILDREEGGIGKISAAPIRLGEQILGIWILGSYTETETEKLKKIYEDHWVIATLLSDYAYKNAMIDREIAKSRGAGAKLREELARQNIINEALSKINSKLVDNVDSIVEETIKDAGIHMNIDKVFIYTMAKGNS